MAGAGDRRHCLHQRHGDELRPFGDQREAGRAERRAGDSAGTPRAAADLVQLDALVAAFERVRLAGALILRRHDLAIDGQAVMQQLGPGPGPQVGRALGFLTDRVIEDPSLNTPQALRRLLEGLAAEAEGEKQS